MDSLPEDFKRPMGVPPVGTIERGIGDLRVSHQAMAESITDLKAIVERHQAVIRRMDSSDDVTLEDVREAYSRQASTIRWLEQVVKRAEQGYDNLAGRVTELEKDKADLVAALEQRRSDLELRLQDTRNWLSDVSAQVKV